MIARWSSDAEVARFYLAIGSTAVFTLSRPRSCACAGRELRSATSLEPITPSPLTRCHVLAGPDLGLH
jgi:hypothetical protein